MEKATEVLSGYLERDISQDSLQDIKQKVQDKYRWVKVHVCCAACVCWNRARRWKKKNDFVSLQILREQAESAATARA